MGFALIFWIIRLIFGKRKTLLSGPDFAPIALLFIVSVISTAASFEGLSSLSLLWKEIGQYLVFYLLLMNHRTHIHSVFLLVVLAIVPSSFSALHQYFIENIRQVSAFMDNPNIFSGYVSCVTLIAAGYTLNLRRGIKKACLASIVIFLSFILLLTGSRINILLLLCGVFALISIKGNIASRIVTFVVFIACLYILFNSGLLSFSNLERFDQDILYGGLGSRLDIWKGTLLSIHDYPVLGVGPGNFSSALKRLQLLNTYTPKIDHISHAHNILLQLWAELGFLAPGIFLWLVIRVFKRITMTKFRSQPGGRLDPFKIGLLVAVAGVVVQAMSDFPFFASSYTYFTICLYTYYITRNQDESVAPANLLELHHYVVIVLFIVLICHVIRLPVSFSFVQTSLISYIIIAIAIVLLLRRMPTGKSSSGADNYLSIIVLSTASVYAFCYACFLSTSPAFSCYPLIRVIIPPVLFSLLSFIVHCLLRSGGSILFSPRRIGAIVLLLSLVPIIETTREANVISKGLYCLKNKQFEQAETLLSTALHINPHSYQAHMVLGQHHSICRNVDTAHKHFKEALEILTCTPGRFRFISEQYLDRNMWNSYIQSAHKEGLIKYLPEIVSPMDEYHAINVGRALLNEYHLETGIRLLERKISSQATQEITVCLANAYLHAERPDRASALLADYLHAVPDDYSTRFLLGKTLLYKGDILSASLNFQQVCAVSPNNVFFKYYMATALEKLSEKQQALSIYNALLSLRPDFVEAAWKMYGNSEAMQTYMLQLSPELSYNENINKKTTLSGFTIRFHDTMEDEFYAVTFWDRNEEDLPQKSVDHVICPEASAQYFISGNHALGFHRENMVPNGTFNVDTVQTGMPSRWRLFRSNIDEALISIAQENGFHGHSLTMTSKPTMKLVDVISSQFSVTSARNYLQGGWLKTDDSIAHLGRRWYGSHGLMQGEPYVVRDTYSPQWKAFAGLTRSPSRATNCRVWLVHKSLNGNSSFDDLFFFPVHDPWDLLTKQRNP